MDNVNNDARTQAQVVASEYDGYLHSDRLDQAWSAGWHSAINHAVAVLTKHVTTPGCQHRYPDGTHCRLTDHSAPGLAEVHGYPPAPGHRAPD